MRRLRDVFYINAFPENKEIVYYGMQLNEFLKCTPVEINKLLILEGEYFGRGFRSKTKLQVVENDEMEEFLGEDIYSYGNFAWVDFEDRDNLEKLEPIEIAELLYLGHMFKPINSPFFEKIQNRYAYLAHDDGWFCRLYCKEYSDFQEIICNKIINTVSTSKRRKIYPFSKEVKEELLNLSKDGLLIDFNNFIKYEKSIEVPIYTIGKFLDMDEMYNNLQANISRAKYSAYLVHKNKKWVIDYISKR